MTALQPLYDPASSDAGEYGTKRSHGVVNRIDESKAVKDLHFDACKLQTRYDLERNKRLAANPTGLKQYFSIDKADANFGRFFTDPYVENIKRTPIEGESEILIIGGGFGGILVAARLLEQGLTNIRILEKGGDFGGTWYWNRYPGAQCDIESYVYMPLLQETGYVPTEKYAKCDELLNHARRLGHKFGLYSRTTFQTEVTRLEWDGSARKWLVYTDREDVFRASFVVSAAGPLHRPKLPNIPGLKRFSGHSFHTTRWDYQYTGGDHTGTLQKLSDKRVGIIGTGATAVQVIPHLGQWARELFVFQRTPSSVDVRNNRPTDPKWVQSLGPDWQKKRMDNFNMIVNGGHQDEDLVADGWTDIMRKLTPQSVGSNAEDAEKTQVRRQLLDFEKMESIRSRVDSIVEDAATAERLKPYYNQFCKRPCFHDQYLQSFNRSNVHLIDTDGHGVRELTEKGVIANGEEYELDCLIYATGFDIASELSERSGFEIHGEQGLTLADKWRNGASTLHGCTTRGFPNICFISIVQAAFTPNVIHATDEQAKHFAYMIKETKMRGAATFQPTEIAEKQWVSRILALGKFREAFNRECTPGYYNNEGKLDDAAARNATYGGGPLEFFDLIDRWRKNGDMEGMELKV